ncbi:carboxypeptidase M32 [Candidatus Thorarchaeota archaeon]|nr:MAG: carboxypeptidase M32 [Candidatus Thorarchaeota archaeon]
MEAYNKILERSKELFILQSATGIINWDLETNMPPRGLMLRSEQLSLLRKLTHRMATDPQVGELITKAERESDSLSEEQKRNLYLTKREYDALTQVPEELVGQMAKQRTIAIETWKKAKAANNWKMFEPELEKMIDLSRQYSTILAEVREIPNLYDAMLDQFERGMRAVQVSKIFGELRDKLVPLATKCAEASTNIDTSYLDKIVPVDTQRKIAIDLSSIIGYDTVTDKAGGRIDEVEHPFTSGYYDDVRITVKYHEDNVSSMIYAILHEAGHALYEQNLNQDWKYQTIGQAASYGIHESQSRFIENNIGRSSEFINFYLPKLNELTGGLYSGISSNDFAKAMNLVEPSLIRIEADEVTYSLHIIIRYEIERDLFTDKISISELPHVWNERYEEYLGIKVPDDTNGVLQDTHWGAGYFGYFPSYAMGNVYDGMWIEKLAKDVPNWLDEVGRGNTVPAIDWMKKNVHYYSSLYDPADLVKEVTGKDTTAGPYLKYLEDKYSDLFEF